MKGLNNLIILGVVGYIVYAYAKKNKKGQVAAPPVNKGDIAPRTNRPMEYGVANMSEMSCAKRAESIQFGDDQQKYEWIVACSQQYSHANGLTNDWNNLTDDAYNYASR